MDFQSSPQIQKLFLCRFVVDMLVLRNFENQNDVLWSLNSSAYSESVEFLEQLLVCSCQLLLELELRGHVSKCVTRDAWGPLGVIL